MSTRNLPGSKGPPAHNADNLTAICELIVWKMWEPRRLTILWASTAFYWDSFTFFLSLEEGRTAVSIPFPIIFYLGVTYAIGKMFFQ
jgi:hypothetical protein